MKKTHILNIILVLLSMLTIFLFSHQSFKSSESTSKKVVKEVVSFVMKDDEETMKKLETTLDDNLIIVRKCAHIAEFFILGFLAINMLKDYKKISYELIVLCIIACMLYACTDELHQLFIAGRTAKALDVGIDTFGATLGIFTYYLIYKKYRSKKLIDK